jgi:hypothetical protein
VPIPPFDVCLSASRQAPECTPVGASMTLIYFQTSGCLLVFGTIITLLSYLRSLHPLHTCRTPLKKWKRLTSMTANIDLLLSLQTGTRSICARNDIPREHMSVICAPCVDYLVCLYMILCLHGLFFLASSCKSVFIPSRMMAYPIG